MALDLGCGTGEHARYLAGLGWSVTAVDFIPTAVAQARRRDGAGRVTWRVANVTLPEEVDPQGTLAGGVGLVLDVGCRHKLDLPGRSGWAATVARVAAPEATVLVRSALPGNRGVGRRGIASVVASILLALVSAASGVPKVLGTATMVQEAHHLGLTAQWYVVIGALELVATAVLLVARLT
jgi:SAM-dependent methyltransferase